MKFKLKNFISKNPYNSDNMVQKFLQEAVNFLLWINLIMLFYYNFNFCLTLEQAEAYILVLVISSRHKKDNMHYAKD